MNEQKFLKCKRCGRRLSSPESQMVGYGPISFRKVQEEESIQCDLFDFEVTE